MKIKILQNLLDQQPSVAGTTFLVGALYVLSIALTVFFCVLGLGLLIEGKFDILLFLNWVSRQFNLVLNEDQRQAIAYSFGSFSLILSVVFAAFIYLCRMVLKRNLFIIQMEEWIYNNITEISRPKTSKKK